jgi:hypothetical protein
MHVPVASLNFLNYARVSKQPETIMLQGIFLTVASILGAFLPTIVALDVTTQSNPSHSDNTNRMWHQRDLQGVDCLIFDMLTCPSESPPTSEVWTWTQGCSANPSLATCLTVPYSWYSFEGKTTNWAYGSTAYWATIDAGASPMSTSSVGQMNTGDLMYGGKMFNHTFGNKTCFVMYHAYVNVTLTPAPSITPVAPTLTPVAPTPAPFDTPSPSMSPTWSPTPALFDTPSPSLSPTWFPTQTLYPTLAPSISPVVPTWTSAVKSPVLSDGSKSGQSKGKTIATVVFWSSA